MSIFTSGHSTPHFLMRAGPSKVKTRAWTIPVSIALLATLSGCLQPEGDFGRRDNGFISTTLDPGLDRLINLQQRKIANNLPRTNDEVEVEDRLRRFLTLPHTRTWIYPGKAGAQRAAFYLRRPYLPPEDRYYRDMKARDFQTTEVIYSALAADVQADIETLPGLYQSFCTVQKLDERRRLALSSVSGIGEDIKDEVRGRLKENKLIRMHFALMVDFRYKSYSYALKRLLVEAPYDEARLVDATLSELAIYSEAAQLDDYCSGDDGTRMHKAASVSLL